MALMTCPECAKEVSDSAITCPNCGFDLAEKRKADVTAIIKANRKKSRRRLLVILLALVVAGGVINALTPELTPEQKAKNAQLYEEQKAQRRADKKAREDKERAELQKLAAPFEQAIRATVKASRAYGNYQLEFSEITDTKCSVSLTYPKGPMRRDEAATLSQAAVHAILQEFMRQGKKPAEDAVSADAVVYTAAKGATGKDLVNVYGQARYNWSDDQVVWKPE